MATQLAITEQPTAVPIYAPFAMVVSAENGDGSVDTSYSGSITIALASNPGGATLGGTLTVAAVSGVALFSGLTLNVVAQGYTIQATASGLTSATSSGINTWRRKRWDYTRRNDW
jgi:hypothetical protein